MAVTSPPRMTVEEFSRLPEGPPYFEFENGELVPTVSPRSNHQDVIIAVRWAIRTYSGTNKFVREIHGNPHLAVEVTSVNPYRDRIQKSRVYQDNKVDWCWMIDSDTLGIEEYKLDAEGCVRAASVASGEEFHPRLFPDLTLHLPALLSDGADA